LVSQKAKLAAAIAKFTAAHEAIVTSIATLIASLIKDEE
jgi:hypothetical protein